MKIEFKESSTYIPRSSMIYFATDNSIVGPAIAFTIWSALFFAMYVVAFHKNPPLVNIVFYLFPCIFCIPRVFNTFLVFKLVVENLYVNKYPCSICIEFGEELITQFNKQEFRCQVNIGKAKIFQYGEYLVFQEGCSVILVPPEKIKDIPKGILPLNLETLDLGWEGKLYEKAIREFLPKR